MAADLSQPDFDVSSFRVVVESLVRYPYKNEACQAAYQERVQKSLDEGEMGFKIKVEKGT